MRVHHVLIANFRGIKSLDWLPRSGLNCLIGPGDSGKTTVLDAISLALAHRWNLTFCDSDFYGGVPNEIQIEVTLTELDGASMAKEVFGDFLRGVDENGGLHDEPVDGTVPAVTVRLSVDASLEPSWSLVRGPTYEPRRISAQQRQHFMAHRVDDAGTDHLTWSRTSALARGTASAPELPGMLADSQRAARQAIFDHPVESLQLAADEAAEAAKTSAAAALSHARPGLDPAVQLRSGSIVLHDGMLPVASRGLGSRRLTSIAIQRWATDGTGILLLDEVESGLEPHRVRHLIRALRSSESGKLMQVFCTTHAPTVIEELSVPELCVVRSVDGVATVRTMSDATAAADGDWQALARSSPSAFLSRRIGVAEGKTEVGVVRALTAHFDSATDGEPAALRGVLVVDGGGASVAPGRAAGFAGLGYEVAVLVDNDGAPTATQLAVATAAGCSVVQVSVGKNIETEITASLPIEALQKMVELAVTLNESEDPCQSVRDTVRACLPEGSPVLAGVDVNEWISSAGADAVRQAIGEAASKKNWFKTVSRGQQLGELLVAYIDQLAGTPIANWIRDVQTFTHPAVED